MADLTVRSIEAHELDDWARVESAAFGGFPRPEVIELERPVLPLDRTFAAFEGQELVGTAGAYPFEMTVPGGNTVAVSGLTAVGTLATHRRRGVLRTMMRHQLDDSAGRGEVATVLNASESSIYGRFGYGLAQQYQRVRIDPSRAQLHTPPAPRRLRLVPKGDAAHRLRPIYDAYRVTRAGELSRPERWWDALLGDVQTWKGGGDVFVVIAEPEGHDPGGYVLYTLQDRESSPWKRLVVRELVAADPETEAALWRYCLEVDLVDEVEVESRPLDDPIRWRLRDPRQLRVLWQSDFVWVRLLDVPAALAGRAYDREGEIVLDVHDEFRPQQSGRYRLRGSPKAGECEPTDEPVDLEVTVADLGALYLGGVRATTLARAGRTRELRPGALQRADDLFVWPVAPHCYTRF